MNEAKFQTMMQEAGFQHLTGNFTPENSQPGDILCFSGHVGIYIGNNEVLEAKSSAKNIVVSKLSDWGYAAEQKNTTYDTADVMPTPVDVEPIEAIGTVITKSTPLRIRELPSETATQTFTETLRKKR